MKSALLIFTLLLSTLGFATERIDLIDKNLEIELDGGSKVFEIERSIDTPKKVSVLVNYTEASSVCVDWDYDEVWVPPTREYVCDPDRESCHMRNGRRICTRVPGRCYYRHVPGYYDTRRYCVDYEDVWSDVSKTFKLDFKKAKKLDAVQKEVFKVKVVQKSRYSKKLKLSGEVIEADSNYEIKAKNKVFGGLSLKFKVK